MNKRDLGKKAERIAVNYLKSRGYKILKSNWTCYAGEIDIVAFKSKLTFVEVKSAFSGFCSPCELLTWKKKKSLLRSVSKYLLQNFLDNSKIPDYQIDLICVYKSDSRISLKHYQNIDCQN